MPIYKDGKKYGAIQSPSVDIGSTYESILKLLRSSPNSLGDLSRFSELEMKYIRLAMFKIAGEIVEHTLLKIIAFSHPFEKVVDSCTVPIKRERIIEI